ncbi:hypothetical protein EDC01DRAFT_633855 [Geopyxis carbonaria]|nr:hypothetical protein EDC01DRAFT_633855 [Geopyxis carbonaria]
MNPSDYNLDTNCVPSMRLPETAYTQNVSWPMHALLSDLDHYNPVYAPDVNERQRAVVTQVSQNYDDPPTIDPALLTTESGYNGGSSANRSSPLRPPPPVLPPAPPVSTSSTADLFRSGNNSSIADHLGGRRSQSKAYRRLEPKPKPLEAPPAAAPAPSRGARRRAASITPTGPIPCACPYYINDPVKYQACQNCCYRSSTNRKITMHRVKSVHPHKTS